MANIEHFIPFLIKWEAGISKKSNETNESLFQRARKTGWADDPDDLGGQTMVGVTMATYEEYCRRKGYPKPTTGRLMDLSYNDWKSILKMLYWDRWNADEIRSQSIAEIVCDFVWASGVHGIKVPQDLVGIPLILPLGDFAQSNIGKWFGEYATQIDIIAKGNLLYNEAMMAQSNIGAVIGIFQ